MVQDCSLGMALGFVWGGLWALFLQCTETGRFLADRRTWITVVVGVGIDLLILLPFMPFAMWLLILAIFTTSSIPIIARSLLNELREVQELETMIDGDKTQVG